MKKLVKLICLAAILCAAYLVLTTPRGDAEPVIKSVDAEINDDKQPQADDAEMSEIADQVKTVGEDAVKQADEFIEDTVKKADEKLGEAVEQADKAIGDAVESAAEGAKQGFIESLKKSADEFWEKLFH